MKHARADYDRIQDPAHLIPADEPVFLLRGQDQFAPHNLMDYAARCEESGLADMAARVRAHAEAMRQWQAEHGSKLPDVPEEKATSNAATRRGIW
jgi:hypothetical protein